MTTRCDDVLDALRAQRVVPVLRSSSLSEALDTSRALAAAGLGLVELTTSIPDVLTGVEALVREGLVVGLGTVRDAATIEAAADAGASFVVSYCHPQGFMDVTRERDVLGIPGAFTPQELQAAADAGARLAKLFPAWQSSPRLIKDLAPLLPDLELLPTGGLDAKAAGAWLAAGAAAVGVGSSLVTAAGDGADGVEERVRLLISAISQASPPPLEDMSLGGDGRMRPARTGSCE